MPKDYKAVAKAKAAGVAASSGKSRKAAEDAAANPFSGHDKLKPDEVDAIRMYQGFAFQSINAHLRGIRPGLTSDVEAAIPRLDSAIAISALKADVTLYRGVTASKIDYGAMAPGQIIDDEGFHSTSMSKSVAEKFVGVPDLEGRAGALITIKAAKGQKGLAVHKVDTGSKYSDPSSPSAEHEVLLPRGSSFKVEGVKKRKDGNYNVTVRLL